MNMREWAKSEVEMMIKKEREAEGVSDGEFSYGGSCYESAFKAFESLCEDGHSGMSIHFTKRILNRLIDGNPLSAIEDIPEVWEESNYGENDGIQRFQCNRMSSLFKYIHQDRSVKFSDVNQYVCIDIDNRSTYTGGGAHRIIEELYPITLPYSPIDRIKLYTKDFLVDPDMGDYDTKAYLYLDHPTEGRTNINRFFAETKDGWVEISVDEYDERVKKSVNRQEGEANEK